MSRITGTHSAINKKQVPLPISDVILTLPSNPDRQMREMSLDGDSSNQSSTVMTPISNSLVLDWALSGRETVAAVCNKIRQGPYDQDSKDRACGVDQLPLLWVAHPHLRREAFILPCNDMIIRVQAQVL